MKAFSRWFLALLLLAIIVEIVLLAPEDLGMNVKIPKVVNSTFDDTMADQVMGGVHLIETSDGRKEWELWAKKAFGFKTKGDWDLSDVTVIFYSEDGLDFKVTGDKGSLKAKSKDLYIFGNVVTKTSNDYRFNTDSMTYSSKEKVLKTNDPVVIIGPKDESGYRMQLNGIGMLAKTESNKIWIHSDVHGKKPFSAERVLKIRSNEAELSGLSRQALFRGQVTMEIDTLTVKGQESQFIYGSEQRF